MCAKYCWLQSSLNLFLLSMLRNLCPQVLHQYLILHTELVSLQIMNALHFKLKHIQWYCCMLTYQITNYTYKKHTKLPIMHTFRFSHYRTWKLLRSNSNPLALCSGSLQSPIAIVDSNPSLNYMIWNDFHYMVIRQKYVECPPHHSVRLTNLIWSISFLRQHQSSFLICFLCPRNEKDNNNLLDLKGKIENLNFPS
jgi:hypothetical protein